MRYYILTFALLASGIVPAGGQWGDKGPLDTEDVRCHDPSMIVWEGETAWCFSTGHGIYSHSSKDLEKWTRGPRVFEKPLPWLTAVAPGQRGHLWAPDIIKVGGRFMLYYSVSAFGKQTSALALATSPTLDPGSKDFEWKDRGIVLRSKTGDPYNAIDPSLMMDGKRLWMAFGSFWNGLYIVELDSETGLLRDPESKPIHLAAAPEIEAPFLHKRGDYYYLFMNWGRCCRGVDSTYRILVGRSKSVTGPYLDRDGVDLRKGGGTLLLESEGNFIGPGHASIVRNKGDKERLACHFYDGSRRGRSFLKLLPLKWTDDHWPEVSPPEN